MSRPDEPFEVLEVETERGVRALLDIVVGNLERALLPKAIDPADCDGIFKAASISVVLMVLQELESECGVGAVCEVIQAMSDYLEQPDDPDGDPYEKRCGH